VRLTTHLHLVPTLKCMERWAAGWVIRGSSPGTEWEFFLFTIASRPALGPTQSPIQWVPRALSLGVKWQGHEPDHSLPSSAEVKKSCRYSSTPSIRLYDAVLSENTGTNLPLS
jgi:hypothetical protein